MKYHLSTRIILVIALAMLMFGALSVDTEHTAQAAIIDEADLSVEKVASADTVLPGDTITFTITVENLGPLDATGVELEEQVAFGSTFVSVDPSDDCELDGNEIICEIGDLEVDETFVVTAIVTVNLDAPELIGDDTNVEGDQLDPFEDNNEVAVFTNVLGGIPLPDLVLEFDVEPDPLVLGGIATYEVFVENVGDGPATEMEVEIGFDPDQLGFVHGDDCEVNDDEEVLCEFGTLLPGDNMSVIVEFDVNDAGPENLVEIEMVAESNELDANPDDNEADEETQVITEVNVNSQIEVMNIQTPAQGTTSPGGIYTITVNFTNNGAPLDNLFTRVDVLDYLSGATPPPELSNRTQGTPPNVGAELGVDFPGDTLDTGESTEIVFELLLPVIEPFRASVNFLTTN